VDAEPEEIFLVVVVPTVSEYLAAAEEADEVFENIPTGCSLDHSKFRTNLPSKSHLVAPIDRAAETALSIDEPNYPANGSESFLLVFRTRRIVTAHAFDPRDRV